MCDLVLTRLSLGFPSLKQAAKTCTSGCVVETGGKAAPGDAAQLPVGLGYRQEMCTASSQEDLLLLLKSAKTRSLTLYKLVTRLIVPLFGMLKNGSRYGWVTEIV